MYYSAYMGILGQLWLGIYILISMYFTIKT